MLVNVDIVCMVEVALRDLPKFAEFVNGLMVVLVAQD
jgi:hypothetical protein